MKNTDRVIVESNYTIPNNDKDFIVNMNVRRNILLTCVNDVVMFSGEIIEIDTRELQASIISEYKQKQKRVLK
jgi:hypothetical protein